MNISSSVRYEQLDYCHAVDTTTSFVGTDLSQTRLQVHQHPCLADPGFLAAAVVRYERLWLPLLAAHAAGCEPDLGTSSGGTGSGNAQAGTGGSRSGEDGAASVGTAVADSVIGGGSGSERAGNGSGGGCSAGGGDAAEAGDRSSHGGPLAAPLDVAWVWMGHAIAPAAYRKVLSSPFPFRD